MKKLMVMVSCVYCCSSGAVGSTGGFVHEARPGAERGERPQGGVGRRPPPGAQHVQGRRSRVAAGSAGEEEDVERGGGERVEGVTPHTGYMQKKKKKKDDCHCSICVIVFIIGSFFFCGYRVQIAANYVWDQWKPKTEP